ncbi:LysR family transcriptional regulator [Bradyrhizobium diazoefficiens]|jgi:LysR family transcriptional regulator, cyn operon transcriptional activator|nr:LysR substrate-binding domain-containing protein [Bradyrhizobium diazoefficiens]MBR0966005.1 LysR family transcriptional regulator [Bradyrhizobium diazoefficiens]MBR1015283.1 LysR family transcriptional regulator [Bradyrhizobium diazoefficiens]MBR1052956.1 LysR family transcriptional regulator [Bradyrhizobium diazoefficiens]MBR1110367.1 LysR family transcriptional regulator [Bradyrhizobium diazoefficiens]
MEIRRLRYFLAVAEHGSMAAAANAIDIAQPTLSQQIRALEESLGSVLFDRTGRGMQLTESGRVLLVHARRLVNQAEAARVAVMEIEAGVLGAVRVGVIHTYNTAFLPRVLGQFARRFPGVSLLVEEATASEIEKAVMLGHYDIGFAFSPTLSRDIASDVLFNEALVLVTGASNPLADRCSIELGALSEIPLALLTRAFSTRRLLDTAAGTDITLDVRLEMNSIEALLELARQGVFPTVLANKSLVGRHDLAMIPITRPQVTRSAALLWDTHRYQTKATRAFMEIARNVIKDVR